eukprot:TRINITY_DN3174_c0_g1_i1.p2 TRINITY_DN3174_c0_g1~~TRINITY_DN3174_c0_g1_i1.p2  ORF type:complete len:122 (+),score=43.70 TRINITY_DN3174_c0_g1_i1:83-448(+)
MAYEAKVISYNPVRGFGFIEWADAEKGGLFFNAKNCVDTYPKEGEMVQFDVEDSTFKPGHKQAINVTGGSLPQQLYRNDKGKGKGKFGPYGGDGGMWDMMMMMMGMKGKGKGKGGWGKGGW